MNFLYYFAIKGNLRTIISQQLLSTNGCFFTQCSVYHVNKSKVYYPNMLWICHWNDSQHQARKMSMKVKIIKGVAYCTYHWMSKVFCCIVRDVQKFPGLRRHHQEAIKSLKKEERKKSHKRYKNKCRERYALQNVAEQYLLLNSGMKLGITQPFINSKGMYHLQSTSQKPNFTSF